MLTMRSTVCSVWLFASLLGGCKDDGGSGFAGELTFAGQHDLLPGFDVDTGWTPEQSPASVRVTASASGMVAVSANATTDGSTLMPVPGSGTLSVEGSLLLEVSARIDASGVEYEGVVDAFEYGIEAQPVTFDPFALEQPVSASAELPAQELGRVPIPSVPGSTLVLEITGGTIDTVFEGTCATTADGLGQVTGRTTMSGTVEAASSIEIEIPIVGTETFGPFAFTIPVPEIVQPLDLGTVSVATGETVPDQGVCSTVAGTGGTDDATTGPSGDAGSSSTTAGGSADTTTTGSDDTGSDTADDGPTSTTGGSSDPAYPFPEGGTCPQPDQVLVGTTSDDNAICIPPCDGMGLCPSPATGNAAALCSFNPDASYADCMLDTDCLGGELCLEGICWLEPSHCLLFCDMGETCPDTMFCDLGVCVYPV
jgi:hypothetical protein